MDEDWDWWWRCALIRCMKVVLPDPAIPIVMTATGGCCVEVVVEGVGFAAAEDEEAMVGGGRPEPVKRFEMFQLMEYIVRAERCVLLQYAGRVLDIVLEAEVVQRVWSCSVQHVKMMSKALASKLPLRQTGPTSQDEFGNIAACAVALRLVTAVSANYNHGAGRLRERARGKQS